MQRHHAEGLGHPFVASIRVLVEVVDSFCHGLLPLSRTAEMALERRYEPEPWA